MCAVGVDDKKLVGVFVVGFYVADVAEEGCEGGAVEAAVAGHGKWISCWG